MIALIGAHQRLAHPVQLGGGAHGEGRGPAELRLDRVILGPWPIEEPQLVRPGGLNPGRIVVDRRQETVKVGSPRWLEEETIEAPLHLPPVEGQW